MGIKYLANTVVITTDMPIEDLDKAFKINSKAGVLKDEKGNDIFAATIDMTEHKPLHDCSVTFNTVEDGKAAIKFEIPPYVAEEEKKDYIAGILTAYWSNLKAVMEALNGVLNEYDSLKSDIMAEIE